MTEQGYAIKVLGPGHVVLSRKPEDIQEAWLEALRPAIEAVAAGYASERFWWALVNRSRSRAVTRRKQRNHW